MKSVAAVEIDKRLCDAGAQGGGEGDAEAWECAVVRKGKSFFCRFEKQKFSYTFVEIFEKMSAIDIRTSIATILDNTTDEETLDAYYQILLNLIRVQNRTVVAYDADEKPLTLQQLRQEVEAASTRVKAGRFVRHDEVIKQAENW